MSEVKVCDCCGCEPTEDNPIRSQSTLVDDEEHEWPRVEVIRICAKCATKLSEE